MNEFVGSQPFVRHLAWMLRAPRLLDHPLGFHPGALADDRVWQTLARWDKTPTRAPSVLLEPPPRRLGHYFETLYRVLMEDLLGWQVVASNLPVREGGRTLGELDLLVRDPVTGHLQHHEIAIKFYLGYAGAQGIRWYGPDARDRLDLKQSRLLQHQSRMTLRPSTLRTLHEMGIDGPVEPKIFMAGYLFQPRAGDLPRPHGVPEDHGRGQWLRVSEAGREMDGNWVPLYKPHWLGSWRQSGAPESEPFHSALNRVFEGAGPRLFANLVKDEQSGEWVEHTRVFVVPDRWPF